MLGLRMSLTLAVGFFAACSGSPPATSTDAQIDAPVARAPRIVSARVLMLGNSHTAFSTTGTDVAAIWHQLNPAMTVERIATPGLTLRDHANNTQTRAMLRDGMGGRGPYDIVVLQEQSGRLAQGATYDVGAAQALADIAYDANPCAIVVFNQIQTEPSSPNYTAALTSYQESAHAASDAVGAILVPTGDIFASVRAEARATYDAMVVDTSCCGYHATPVGGYAHALALDVMLTGRAPSTYSPLDVSASDAQAIVTAASQVLSDREVFARSRRVVCPM